MSNLIVAFLFAGGGGVWVYIRLMRKTGNNTKNSLMASTVTGVLIFMLLFVILSLIF